jgi:hypothetical protein
MANKAIFFTVFNRPEYLKQTLEQWEKVRGLDQYDIYFRIDPSNSTEDVVEEINKFSSRVNASVKSILNLEKQGCAHNTWNGFNSLFDEYNFVVLAEDDILPSTDVAEYFTFLERKYTDDLEVLTISANYELPSNNPHAVSKLDIFRGQIWGTWKNRWDNFIKDTWDFDYSSGDNGGPSGWDWNLTLRVIPNNKLKSIAPHSSRSQHIGENGLHCDPSMFSETQMTSFKIDRPWKDLVEL